MIKFDFSTGIGVITRIAVVTRRCVKKGGYTPLWPLPYMKRTRILYAAVPEIRRDFIQYRTYRSCRTVGALIFQNQVITFAFRTGRLFFFPINDKTSQIIPPSNFILHGNTWGKAGQRLPCSTLRVMPLKKWCLHHLREAWPLSDGFAVAKDGKNKRLSTIQ